MMLPQRPGSSAACVEVVVPAAASLPRTLMLALGTPRATSWSRADSAAARLSYIAVRIRSGISRFPFLGFGLSRVAAFQPLDLRALRPERHRLAHLLGAAPFGDPDLFLEDQLRRDHEPFLEDGNDHDPVLLPHRRRRFHGPPDRDALDADLLLPQGGLGDLLAGVDVGADNDSPAL